MLNFAIYLFTFVADYFLILMAFDFCFWDLLEGKRKDCYAFTSVSLFLCGFWKILAIPELSCDMEDFLSLSLFPS